MIAHSDDDETTNEEHLNDPNRRRKFVWTADDIIIEK